MFAGPPVGVAHTQRATTGMTTQLRLWTSDVTKQTSTSREQRRRRPSLKVTWEKFRGPGDVTFDPAQHVFEESADQEPVTTATFSAPGEYILRVEAQDETGPGGGGSQCCWTSAHVKVMVSGGAESTGQ